jgi:hypothetical protein
MAVNWDYFDKFEQVNDKYLPIRGEGETKATQIVTAVNKLIYKWYNDGDVFDNTYHLEGWANDLSSYANWLYYYTENALRILDRINACYTESDYENLLKDLADMLLNEEYLAEQDKIVKEGSVYKCAGKFEYKEYEEEYDEEYDDEEEYEW